jgi:mannose-6-phosphate isomerase-like protein (cupin superfamily)
MERAMVIDRSTAEHYLWGNNCDGWHLVKGEGLSVIQERVPPGESEKRHRHVKARQFFYILKGEAAMELDGVLLPLGAGQGIEVPPGAVHKFRNDSVEDVEFLVISSPATRRDREDLE